MGDFNADGKADLAVVDSGAKKVTILLGRGDGRFAAGRSVPTGADPQGVAVGDLNHDGHLDLAVADRDSSDVTVLLGDGKGGFVPTALLSTNIPSDFTYGDPGPVAIGDYNGDGNPDIAVNTIGPGGRGEVETYAGSGNGMFADAVLVTLKDEGVGSAASMSVSDLNEDGRPDLVLLNGYSDQDRVQTLIGGAGGAFSDGPSARVGGGPNQLVVADFNADGHKDIAVTNHDDGTVTILLGDGHGALTPGPAVRAGGTPEGIVAGDFNGDGHQDLAVVNRDPSTVTILLGDGRGGFAATPPRATGSGPEHLVAGRFDADRIDDLAVENFNDQSLTVLVSSAPSNAFKVVRRQLAAAGRVKVTVRSPDAGAFTAVAETSVPGQAKGRRKSGPRHTLTYARARTRVSGATTATLILKPTAAAARALRAETSLRVKVQITFVPQGGKAATRRLTVTVRRR